MRPTSRAQFWTYDKVTNRFTRIPIKLVAQEAKFYNDETERELNLCVEGPANAALAKLRQCNALSGDERLHLALYIATMMLRVPRRRRKAFELIPEALTNVVENVRARIEEWARSPTADQSLVARRLAEIDRAHERLSRETPDAIIDQIRSPWPPDQMVALLYGMTWRIVSAHPTHRYLTSDNLLTFSKHTGWVGQNRKSLFHLRRTWRYWRVGKARGRR